MNMTSMQVAIGIWWKTVLLNSLFTGTWAVFEVGLMVFPVMIVLAIVGFVISLPLLPLISYLLRVYRLLPYSSRARYTWFKCMLLIMVWLFYTGILLVLMQAWPPDDLIYYLAATSTCLAILAGTAFSKREICGLQVPSSTPQLIL